MSLAPDLARLDVTTLGRFEVRIESSRGTQIATASPSLELFKYLLCRPELRASPAEIKLALWPTYPAGVDRATAARLRDGSFASARSRLEQWFADNGLPSIAALHDNAYALDRERCTVDALEADLAYARIVRGEVAPFEALALFERFDKPFLPGDFVGRRGKRNLLPVILARRDRLIEQTLRAYAAALRSARANPLDATTARALAERARLALEAIDPRGFRDARAALVALAGDAGEPNRARVHAASRHPASVAENGLIDRAAESDDLFSRLSSAAHARVIVIEGPAGVGSTALARAVTTRLAASGARAVIDLVAAAEGRSRARTTNESERPTENDDADLPTQALERAIDTLGRERTAAALLPVAPDLVRLIPSLEAVFPGSTSAGPPLDAARRAALLASAVRLLDAVLPAAIVIDRLDLDDRATRAFAAEIVHQIGRFRGAVRFAVVLTARPGDEARGLPLDAAERIRLRPLSPDGARALAARLTADPAIAADIARRSDGLPGNIAYLGRSDGRVGPDFAAHRLRAFPEFERALLAAFARADKPVGLASAVAAAGGRLADDDRWYDAHEALLAADLVAEREGGYVVRETLLAESLRADAGT
jgi:hypothetical protein